MFRSTKLWACAGLLALSGAFAGRAAAQTPLFGGTVYREFDLAGRTSPGIADSVRGFFNLYRDVTSGPVLQNLRLWYVSENGRTFADVWARDAGLLDQRYHAAFERFGAFRFSFDRDATPHFISSDARAIAGAVMTGDSLGLPATRSLADSTAWKSAPLIGDVRVKTTDTRASLSINPRPDVDVTASYEQLGRNGQRPFGMTFNGSSGPAREGLAPISDATSRFRFAPSYNGRRLQATFSYEYSSFANDYTRVMLDNPTTATSTTALSAIGQSGLAPDNQAHTFAGSAGYSFSNVSRLTAAASYSVRYQDAAFLARTVNTALDTSSFQALPAGLNAEMHTAMASFGYTTRVDPRVTFSAHYTYFALADRTPETSFYGRVNADRSVQKQWNTREKYPYSRQSAVAEVVWRARPNYTLRLSDNFQQWNRSDTREVGQTVEHMPKLTLTASPLDWMDLRAAYSTGRRFGDGYVPVTTGNNRDLVRYDEADRSTRRFDFDGSFSPIANTSIGFQYGNTQQHYDWSPYGLQRDDNQMIGVDVTWAPTSRISLSAGAMRNTYNQLLRSRYRSGVQASNIQMDWITNELDSVVSYDAAVNLVLIPRQLEASLSFSRVLSTTTLNNSNPYNAVGVDSANAFNSRVTAFPQMWYYLRPITAVVRYNLSQTLTVSARYSMEDYDGSDFRSGGLVPFTSAGTAASPQSYYYLGNFFQGYGARYFTISVSYRPWVPGLRHAVM